MHGMYVEVKGQTLGVGPLLGIKPGLCARQQVPLPIEPSQQPSKQF